MTSYWRISSAIDGPLTNWSIVWEKSRNRVRYSTMNSSASFLFRNTLEIALISKPSSRILSIIAPAWPLATAWGLIKHSEQLESWAVKHEDRTCSEKNRSDSRCTAIASALTCTALAAPSEPNLARHVWGACCFAIAGLVGPASLMAA